MGFYEGFEKRAAYDRPMRNIPEKWGEEVYHGSPEKLKVLRPRNLHGDPNVEDVIFASPYRAMALAYSGKKWGDRDLNQTRYDKGGKSVMTLEEMRPGALQDIYSGQKGYLYTLPAEKFEGADTLGRRNTSEVVSSIPVKPKSAVKIEDVLKVLQQEEGVQLKRFNPKSPSRQTSIKRMKSRMESMTDDEKRQYLRWVGETNPALLKEIEG